MGATYHSIIILDMERKTVEIKDRKYDAYIEGDLQIIIGPPEGLVDELELPKKVATRLHNALHRRGIFNYRDAKKKNAQFLAALQEALRVDAQKLMQAFYESQKEEAEHE